MHPVLSCVCLLTLNLLACAVAGWIVENLLRREHTAKCRSIGTFRSGQNSPFLTGLFAKRSAPSHSEVKKNGAHISRLCRFVQVYEALIEETGKKFIFMRLSAQCVKELKLKPDTDWTAKVRKDARAHTHRRTHARVT